MRAILTCTLLLPLLSCSDEEARLAPYRALSAESRQTYQELVTALSRMTDAETTAVLEAEVLELTGRLRDISRRSRRLGSLPEHLQEKLDMERTGTWQVIQAMVAEQQRLITTPYGRELVEKMQKPESEEDTSGGTGQGGR